MAGVPALLLMACPHRMTVKSELGKSLAIPPMVLSNEIDKIHPIGPIKDDNTQTIIMKFKSHGFRERVYRNRKSGQNKRMRLRVSLTNRRIKLLEKANDLIENVPNIDFAFADTLGNLKLKFINNVNGKLFKDFKNEVDLAEAISLSEPSAVYSNIDVDYKEYDAGWYEYIQQRKEITE